MLEYQCCQYGILTSGYMLSFHPLQVVKEEPGGKEEVTLENEVSDQGGFTV